MASLCLSVTRGKVLYSFITMPGMTRGKSCWAFNAHSTMFSTAQVHRASLTKEGPFEMKLSCCR